MSNNVGLDFSKFAATKKINITGPKLSKNRSSYLGQHECKSMDAVWPTHKKTDEKQSITAKNKSVE